MGIDIGKGCSGFGIFDSYGGLHIRLISYAVESIEIWKPKAKSAQKSLLARDELAKFSILKFLFVVILKYTLNYFIKVQNYV